MRNVGNSSCCLELSEFFFCNILICNWLNLQVVESKDVESKDLEGEPYS